MSSTLRTFTLLAGMTAIFLVVGYLIGGQGGLVIAFGFALVSNAVAYWNSDKIVLRMYKAREVNRTSAPQLWTMVATMAENAGLPMPKVYIIETDQPNAFATGRNPENAAVAATTGLLQRLSSEEVAAVLAHELAHVKNRDTLTMTITATLAGAISMLANMALLMGMFGGNRDNNPLGGLGTLLVAVLAPIAAMIVQMAISRAREYEADRIGAEICGQPLWLASALEKIEAFARRGQAYQTAERNPATAHMFIINPLSGKGADPLFSTHPKTANRIARLREMAGQSAARTGLRARPWG